MLSVCVIGRNEERNLSRVGESLKLLQALPFPVETIFVDSASTDRSLEMARHYFDKVYSLKPSTQLSASAGRYVGTRKASGDWILYLDADMEIAADFIPVLSETVTRSGNTEGVVGRYTNDYGDQCGRENVLRLKGDGRVAPHFGGAVLLPRDLVLRAGNWNPRLFSHEEMDLYTRMRRFGCVVRCVQTPMVVHHTARIPRWKMLLYNILPVPGGIGNKYYGIGQVIASRMEQRSLFSFVRFFHYPFVYWLALTLALLLYVMRLPTASAALLISGVIYVWATRGGSALALYLTFVPQIILGWFRYDRDYVPAVQTEWTIPAAANGGAPDRRCTGLIGAPGTLPDT